MAIQNEKDLDINDFFERKRIIYDIEVEMSGAPKKTNTDNLGVAEEANFNEAVTT